MEVFEQKAQRFVEAFDPKAYALLVKVVTNIVANPDEPKYRRLNMVR